jgi:uncharacterized protein
VKKIFLLLALGSLLLPVSVRALDVPKLEGYVNDYAGIISPQARVELEGELAGFERSDSTQIVILTVPSLKGDTIEDFGIRVADAWKIGQKNKDNGVIFIVSKADRKTRIEVGRGLEGKLTDLMSGRIVDLVVNPRFKRGDFDGGFIAGVSALIDVTRGEFKTDGNHAARSQEPSRYFTLLIFGAFAILILGSFSRVLGVVAGAIGLPAFAFIAFSATGLILLIILAVVGMIVGLVLPFLFSSGGRGGPWIGGGFGGGFYGGGFGGGGFGGGGFGGGGGGFSGGGGGFGGGGASGGW